MTTTYQWEGPLTYVRERVLRGSAAGAHTPSTMCVMAGYSHDGYAVTRCGTHIAKPRFSRKLETEDRGIEGVWQQRVCQRCA